MRGRNVNDPILGLMPTMGGLGVSLSLLAGGTFSRSTEGSYLIGAPTDGSTPFLAWAGVDVRRMEDRGDGYGSMLLMEGSRTNQAPAPRDLTSVAWTNAGSGSTATAAQPNSPDATSNATRVQIAAAAGFSRWYAITPGGGRFSVWAKTRNGNPWGSQMGGANPHVFPSTGGVWRRDDADDGTATAFTPVWWGTGIAAAIDVDVDLLQYEVGEWPSSAIRTGGGTRAADVLSYAAGQYPYTFCTRGLRLQYMPNFSSAELVASGAVSTLLSWSGGAGTDRLMFSHAGGLASVYTQDSTTGAQGTGTKTWNRGQLLTIDVYPSLGRVVCSGFASGDGTASVTPFSWPNGTMYVGSQLGSATGTSFGRYIPTLVGL